MAIRAYSDEDYEVARLASEILEAPCSVVTYVDEATHVEYEFIQFGDYYWNVVDHCFSPLYDALGFTRPIPMHAAKVAQAFGTSTYFCYWYEASGKERKTLMVGPFPWADIADLFDDIYIDDASVNGKPNTLSEEARKNLVSEMDIGEQLQIIENLQDDEWSLTKKPLQAVKLELFDRIRELYNTQLHSYFQNYDPTLRRACDEADYCPFADETCAFCIDPAEEGSASDFVQGSPADDIAFGSDISSASASGDSAIDVFTSNDDASSVSASSDNASNEANDAYDETPRGLIDVYSAVKAAVESLSDKDKSRVGTSVITSLLSALADLSGESPARTQIDPPEESTPNNPNATSHDGGNRIRGDPPKGGDAHPPNTAETND